MSICKHNMQAITRILFAQWNCSLSQLIKAPLLQVKGSGDTIRPCLVPVATLLNHAVWPHIVHYSNLDAQDGSLKLQLFRAAAEGEECCLSYGPLPNYKLLLFYGFTLFENPYDTVDFELVSLAPCCRMNGKSEDARSCRCIHHHVLRLCKKMLQGRVGLVSRLMQMVRSLLHVSLLPRSGAVHWLSILQLLCFVMGCAITAGLCL